MKHRKIKRTTMIALRTDLDLLEELETFIESGKYRNTSHAIREMCRLAMQVLHYQDMMQDPDKAAEFQAKMHEIIQSGEAVDWVKTLDMNQIRGFLDLLNLEKEQRVKVKHLL